MTEDEIYDRVEAASAALMKCATECCRDDSGTFNAFIFGLAVAQIAGSNFSLLPSPAAQAGMKMMIEMLRRTYADGLEVGGPIQ